MNIASQISLFLVIKFPFSNDVFYAVMAMAGGGGRRALNPLIWF